MKKRVLAMLISMMVIFSIQSIVWAEPEETISPETTLEATTETVAPETETQLENTEAPSEVETETVDTSAPTFETVEITEATESTVAPDVDLYVTQSGEEITKMEEETKDPTLKTFLIGILLGIILGGTCGYVLASFLVKQKIGRKQDTIYDSIRHGQTTLATRQLNEKKAAEREVELRKKKEEEALKKKQKETLKKEKAEKKAELKAEQQRKKAEAELHALQKKLGYEPTPVPTEQPQSNVENTNYQTAEPQPTLVEITENGVSAETEKEEYVNFEDMIYQGEDSQGIPYYTDPNDPTQEPFNIVDGKKIFYD